MFVSLVAASARSAIVSAASRALSEVREAVDGLRVQAAVEEGDDSRRLPPLYDPEFLDAIQSVPPPRLVPVFLRQGMARRALAPLLTLLDDSLHRYAERLRTWGAGALKETRPRADLGGAAPIRHAELAALDALVAEIHETNDLSPAPERPPASAA